MIVTGMMRKASIRIPCKIVKTTDGIHIFNLMTEKVKSSSNKQRYRNNKSKFKNGYPLRLGPPEF